MNLNNFLHFNHSCPICGEPLHLYMSWVPNQYNGVMFKAEKVRSFNPFSKTDRYKFVPTEQGFKHPKVDGEHMILVDHGDEFEIDFSSNSIRDEAKKYSIYFFFICNPDGINHRGSGDHEINLYKGCYTRSTPFMELKDNRLRTSIEEFSQLTHKAESFIIKHCVPPLQKIYALSLDYEDKKTTLMHYAVTEEQEKMITFEPNIFEKEMPLLSHRPNLEDKEKLISRFDSWILMS